MRPRLAIAAVLLGCGPFAISTVAAVEERSERGRDPRAHLVVPRDSATIQGAIDAAIDGATIVIMPGVYEEVLTIRSKRLQLRGDGNPEIRGPQPRAVGPARGATGMINYSAGGGGSLQGLLLTGGDNGIVGFNAEEPPSALQVQDVHVQGTGRGVLWSGAPLHLKNNSFSKVSWHAISIPCFSGPLQTLFIDGVAAVDSEQAGIYMSNCPGVASCDNNNAAVNMVKNVSLAFNKGGGIVAVHSTLCVKDSYIDFATTGGMIFLGSEAVTRNNDINFTKGVPLNASTFLFGMGIINWEYQDVPAHVTVENTEIYQPESVGIGNYSSHLAYKSTLMTCAGGEPGVPNILSETFPGQTVSVVDDQGGNKCGCPFANGTCSDSSAGGPQPPQPLGPGALE